MTSLKRASRKTPASGRRGPQNRSPIWTTTCASRSGGSSSACSFPELTPSADSYSTSRQASFARLVSALVGSASSLDSASKLGVVTATLLLGQESLELRAELFGSRNLFFLACHQIFPLGSEGVVLLLEGLDNFGDL